MVFAESRVRLRTNKHLDENLHRVLHDAHGKILAISEKKYLTRNPWQSMLLQPLLGYITPR